MIWLAVLFTWAEIFCASNVLLEKLAAGQGQSHVDDSNGNSREGKECKLSSYGVQASLDQMRSNLDQNWIGLQEAKHRCKMSN